MKILSLILILIPIAACAEPKAIAPTPQPSAIAVSSQPPSLRTTKDGYIAAISESAFNRAVDAVKIRNAQALEALEASGDIFMLPAGQSVQATGCHNLCSATTFRYPGKDTEFWTFTEALAPQLP